MGCGCGGGRPRKGVTGRRPKTATRPKTTAATVPRTLAQRTQQSKSSTNKVMGKLAIQRKRKAAIRRALGRP